MFNHTYLWSRRTVKFCSKLCWRYLGRGVRRDAGRTATCVLILCTDLVVFCRYNRFFRAEPRSFFIYNRINSMFALKSNRRVPIIKSCSKRLFVWKEKTEWRTSDLRNSKMCYIINLLIYLFSLCERIYFKTWVALIYVPIYSKYYIYFSEHNVSTVE